MLQRRSPMQSFYSQFHKVALQKAPDKICGGMQGPWKKTTVIDTSGAGVCGWRALAFAIAGQNARVEDIDSYDAGESDNLYDQQPQNIGRNLGAR